MQNRTLNLQLYALKCYIATPYIWVICALKNEHGQMNLDTENFQKTPTKKLWGNFKETLSKTLRNFE